MKIVIANDHGGYNLKQSLTDFLEKNNYEVINLGTDSFEIKVDYPDYAQKLATVLLENKADLGILICGTGIGMSIAANRFEHIRAALVHNEFEAKMARNHNNANVIIFGARVIGDELAKSCLNVFLNNDFEGGRHQNRLDKISKL